MTPTQVTPVIALYRPHPGSEAALLELVRKHYGILSTEDFVTDYPPYVLRAKDGTVLEIFEWKNQAAVEAAHTNPQVQALWDEFSKVCEFATLGSLQEAADMFPHFARVS